ncbi:hypothetical protein IJ531_01735 [bacterium]|nr:hypothetical protein [bacterium]
MQIQAITNANFLKTASFRGSEIEEFFGTSEEETTIDDKSEELAKSLNFMDSQSRAALLKMAEENARRQPSLVHEYYNGEHNIYEDYTEIE